jgi:tyrosine-protein kinase Etk/Wzc
LEFIDNQLGSIGVSLGKSEFRLEDFRVSKKFMDLSAEGQALFTRLSDLETKRAEESMKMNYYEYILNYVQEQQDFSSVIAPATVGVKDPLLNNLIEQLSTLYAERNTLKLTSTEKNPKFTFLDSQVSSLRATLVENLKNLMKSSQLFIREMGEEIKRYERQVAQLPDTERNLVNIQREYKLNETLYLFLMKKKAEIALTRTGLSPDNEIIDRAVTTDPIAPKNSRNYLIGVMLGFILPVGIVVVRDLLDNKIHSFEDVAKVTRIPILGGVGHSDLANNRMVAESLRGSENCAPV